MVKLLKVLPLSSSTCSVIHVSLFHWLTAAIHSLSRKLIDLEVNIGHRIECYFQRNIKETFEIVITTHCVSLRNSHGGLRCVRLINSVKLALYSLMSSAFNSIHRITMSPRGLSFISLPRTHRLTDQPMSNCNQNGQTTTTSSGNIFQHSLPYSNWFPSSWTKEECDLHSDW